MPARDHPLIETLPLAQRLALSYAPAATREPVLALFALDTRLAGLIRNSREPMLAQLRLAWWRETLGRDAGEWPEGEPLLASLRSWRGAHRDLAALVDGWEALTVPSPLPDTAMTGLAEGRGEAFAALARVLGQEREAERAGRHGRGWSLTDLAVRLSRADERATALALSQGEADAAPRLPRLPRGLRPLAVLHALARHRLRAGGQGAAISPAAMVVALRTGLLGF